jgi:putative ABC transport system permease protein
MKAKSWAVVWQLFAKNSQVQVKRAALTIAAISWGALALLLMLAFGEGLQHALGSARHAMGTNLAVIWCGDTSLAWNGVPAGRPIRPTIDDLAELRSQVRGHSGLTGEVRRWGLTLTANGKTITNQVTGSEAIFGEMRNQIPARGGRFVNETDVRERRRVVFLGDEVARNLFGGIDVVGQRVDIEKVPFTVIGVLNPRIQMGNYSGPDENRAVIPITTFQAQFGARVLENLLLRATDPAQMTHVLDSCKTVMARRYGFDPKDPRVFGIWDTVESNKILGNVILGIRMFLAIIGTLTLAVAGVGVANIMYAVVKERTREIGVQMALGAKPGWITMPIVLESVTYTLVGGICGTGVAVGLVSLIGMIPTEGNRAMQFLGKPTLSLSIGVTAAVILGLIGLLAGYIPARRAARIDPAQTLRYE